MLHLDIFTYNTCKPDTLGELFKDLQVSIYLYIYIGISIFIQYICIHGHKDMHLCIYVKMCIDAFFVYLTLSQYSDNVMVLYLHYIL
jgi:hypothetical protein